MYCFVHPSLLVTYWFFKYCRIFVPPYEWGTMGFGNVCFSIEHICVAQFYFETVVSKLISVSYGILLLHIRMYGLIWASCICGKNVPPGWNDCFHVWLNWFVITLYLSPRLVIKCIGVCIPRKWFEALVGGYVIWKRHTLSSFNLFCEMSEQRLWVMRRKNHRRMAEKSCYAFTFLGFNVSCFFLLSFVILLLGVYNWSDLPVNELRVFAHSVV